MNIALGISAEPGSSWPWDGCAKQSHGGLISVKSQLLFLYLLLWRDVVTNTISQTEIAFWASSNEWCLEAAKRGCVCCDSGYVGSQQPTQPSPRNFHPKHTARHCLQGSCCQEPKPWVTNHSKTQERWCGGSSLQCVPGLKSSLKWPPAGKQLFQHYRLNKLGLHSFPVL